MLRNGYSAERMEDHKDIIEHIQDIEKELRVLRLEIVRRDSEEHRVPRFPQNGISRRRTGPFRAREPVVITNSKRG